MLEHEDPLSLALSNIKMAKKEVINLPEEEETLILLIEKIQALNSSLVKIGLTYCNKAFALVQLFNLSRVQISQLKPHR